MVYSLQFTQGTYDMFSSSFSRLIFRHTRMDFDGERLFNMHILKVLFAIDGKSTVLDISKKLNINENSIKEVIDYIHQLGLIEIIPNEDENLSFEFINFLYNEFMNVVGPIANLVIKEVIEDMGFDKTSFPKNMVAELIQSLTLECDDSSEKNHFIKVMMEKIMNDDL